MGRKKKSKTTTQNELQTTSQTKTNGVDKKTTERRDPLIAFKNEVKVVIADQVIDVCKYMSSKFPLREWSGFLLYHIEGDFIQEPSKSVFHVDYFYPMDIGTAGSTDIENSEEMLDLFDEHPEFEDEKYRHGFLHSHNDMDVFFSGTDEKQLVDGANDFGIFLSIIWNNAGKMMGRISFKFEESSELNILGFVVRNKKDGVGYYTCNLSRAVPDTIDDFIANRVSDLVLLKASSTKTTSYVGYGGTQTYLNIPSYAEEKMMKEMLDNPDWLKTNYTPRDYMCALYIIRSAFEAFEVEIPASHFKSANSMNIDEFTILLATALNETPTTWRSTTVIPDDICSAMFLETHYTHTERDSAMSLIHCVANHNIDYGDLPLWLTNFFKDLAINVAYHSMTIESKDNPLYD